MAWIILIETALLMIGGAVIGRLMCRCYDQQQRLELPTTIRECENMLRGGGAINNALQDSSVQD